MKQSLLCIILAVLSYSVKSAPINAYAKVTAISGNTLTLSNINQSNHSFAAGEQVILMQMQDNVIGANTTNTASFGNISDIGSAGLYRVYTISSFSGSTMILTTNVSAQFNSASSLQVVSYNNLGTNYTVNSNITAVPWNGYVGGVVALQVSGTLTVNASINADEAGFRGGSASGNANGSCTPTMYSSLSNNFGYKGESIHYTTSLYSSRAALANGGGGGGTSKAGGGGGGNYTSGGLGGGGNGCSAANASGGFGGATLSTYVTGSRFFMGGGGGGGQENSSHGSDGAAGGGIVIISADKIATSCFFDLSTISAEGGTADDSGNDGAGGAGAGGTVVLSVNSYSPGIFCPMVLTADGGDGGDVVNTTAYGGGGGGGQGALVFTAALPTQVTSQTASGDGGYNGGFFGTDAGDGQGTNNAGVLVGFAITLPVELLSFTAEKHEAQTLLKWSMAQGPQPATFTIQRSADGSGFADIGTVPGSPDVSKNIDYSYTDALPLPGKNFYRIRAGDVTGESKYTPVVLVTHDDVAGAFHIFPNPAHDNFTIQLPEATTEIVAVTVNDLSGATIYRAQLQAAGGRITVANLGPIVPGAYLVRVETKAGVESGKLLLR